ncbi:MAG TPA: hypothetical protein VMH50_13790 [Thermoleophilia bacterium]|nr:hypothetical protein [Thermoleophilia bacterium]
MTTVQIIGVSVAGAAVLLLIIALLVTRRHRGDEEEGEARPGPSFLDEAPQDTFSVLGRAEQPVEDITLDPAVQRAAEAEKAAAVAAASQARETRRPAPGGLGLDWGPDLSVRELAPEPSATPAWSDDEEELEPDAARDETETTAELRPDETEITGELRPADASATTPKDVPPAPEGESGDQAVAPEPARPARGGPAAGVTAAQESGSESRLVPLSDIIVTTSSKQVDLADPDVRRMLTELVTFEIDQAADFRRRGQTIDAVLQLTEAEKVSRALGMTESAKRIRAMMEEIHRGE